MNGEINIHAKFILKPSLIESKQNMDVPAIVLAFIFGLLIGSFLNVVIYRLPVMLHQESRQAAQEYLGLLVAIAWAMCRLPHQNQHPLSVS